MSRKDLWIRFMAPVVPETTAALLEALDLVTRDGFTHIHLMLSTPGGSVFHGLSLYNYLKGSPFHITTYNFGSVDSIGIVLFCAGNRRISVPNARFLIHGVTTTFFGNAVLDEKGLEESIKSLRIDERNICKVIALTTDGSLNDIIADMDRRTTLNPDEAVNYGLVDAIETTLFPAGAPLITIGERPVGMVTPSASGMPGFAPGGGQGVPGMPGTVTQPMPTQGEPGIPDAPFAQASPLAPPPVPLQFQYAPPMG